MTILFDVIRNLLVLAATCYVVYLLWRWSWIVAVIASIPIYVVILNLVGFATLPLYAFTPENRLRRKGAMAMLDGDVERMHAVTEEFIERFNVNVPQESSEVHEEDE